VDPPTFPNKNVTATIRPENIEVSTTEKPDWLEVQLDTVQPMGSETIMMVSKGEVQITAIKSGFFHMDVDQSVWLNIDSAFFNFFDRETGANLIPKQ
jgi:ABC-type sugar transport system ATPase subunit